MVDKRLKRITLQYSRMSGLYFLMGGLILISHMRMSISGGP
jgi:hypothetical protein